MIRNLILQKLPRIAYKRPRFRTVLRILMGLLLMVFVLEIFRVTAGDNLHEIVPGKVYRSKQPSPVRLEYFIAKYGIKTVINLRGFCPGDHTPWYKEEIRVTSRLGVSHEDITFSANRLPSPDELRRLIEILDHTSYPILFHCKQGADRTGLTATIVHLLFTNATLSEARHQLWPRYGHVQFGRTAAMDEFFDRYERWLDERPHTPELFREWAIYHYTAGPASGTLTPIDPTNPTNVKRGAWTAIAIRATNTSEEPWEFKPTLYSGIHVEFSIYHPSGQKIHSGQAGLFRKSLPPGESIDLTLAVPPLAEPGIYTLHGVLMNGTGAAVPIRQTGLFQFGNDPLMMLLEVN